jgi:transposase-like protein
VIVVAVRWYLHCNLSYRDIEELLVERGVEVDHVTVYRWVQRFTPLLANAARFCRHSPCNPWFVDETYVKVNGGWRYVYRAVDQYEAEPLPRPLIAAMLRRLRGWLWRSTSSPKRSDLVAGRHSTRAPIR